MKRPDASLVQRWFDAVDAAERGGCNGGAQRPPCRGGEARPRRDGAVIQHTSCHHQKWFSCYKSAVALAISGCLFVQPEGYSLKRSAFDLYLIKCPDLHVDYSDGGIPLRGCLMARRRRRQSDGDGANWTAAAIGIIFAGMAGLYLYSQFTDMLERSNLLSDVVDAINANDSERLAALWTPCNNKGYDPDFSSFIRTLNDQTPFTGPEYPKEDRIYFRRALFLPKNINKNDTNRESVQGYYKNKDSKWVQISVYKCGGWKKTPIIQVLFVD
ncbi:hypothetical protein A7A08_02360 [Methyloligella halotolerans]|uniref:Uncharacterized protein n=1 Tax=Methyloligella halotolerans TaxID=1177755 RepID=A0A1E2RWL2_9HYPH|nr:hypothetical protein [Methyloligella halotolerans]ODA66593.1 hypothetical protein A7A08_02360 [Methyloligella halotolerans]